MFNTLSQENQFLLRSIRPNHSQNNLKELEALSQDIDWVSLIELAYQQGVSGLLCQCLLNNCSDFVPNDIVLAAKEHQRLIRERNQQFVEQLIFIAAQLSEENIQIIPFKGVTLCHRVYGDLALRSFADQDFLIGKRYREHTLAKLKALGYSHTQGLTPRQQQAYYDYGGQDILYGDGPPLEPHWTFSPKTFSLQLNYTDWRQRSSVETFHGVPIRFFQAEDEVILLCIHGSKEKWTKLKWLADLAAFVHKHPQLDWELVFQRATEQGVQRMLCLGLQLCKDLFKMDFSSLITTRLEADPVLLTLATQVKTNLFDESYEKQSIYQLSPYYWRLRERWSDRLRYVLLTLMTPRTTHFQTIIFPERLFFLYYVFKPLHDALLLPVWKGFKHIFTFMRSRS